MFHLVPYDVAKGCHSVATILTQTHDSFVGCFIFKPLLVIYRVHHQPPTPFYLKGNLALIPLVICGLFWRIFWLGEEEKKVL